MPAAEPRPPGPAHHVQPSRLRDQEVLGPGLKTLKTITSDLCVMKQILYDMGKQIFFFNYIFPIFD